MELFLINGDELYESFDPMFKDSQRCHLKWTTVPNASSTNGESVVTNCRKSGGWNDQRW